MLRRPGRHVDPASVGGVDFIAASDSRYHTFVEKSGVLRHAEANFAALGARIFLPVTLWGQLKFPKKQKPNRIKILVGLFESLPGSVYWSPSRGEGI